MAERPVGYGLSAETWKKLESKYDLKKEHEAREWMEAVIGEPMIKGESFDEITGADKFQNALKDGVYLCKLINTLNPGAIGKINDENEVEKTAFKKIENISNFLQACENYGLDKTDSFQTVDLYEGQNMWQVINAIHALGRAANKNGWKGPQLGVKQAEKNRREFTEEQLKAGETMITQHMGTNIYASQKGLSFGQPRDIMQHAGPVPYSKDDCQKHNNEQTKERTTTPE